MKTQKIESLLGGPTAQQLCPDAMRGLSSLTGRITKREEEDELFEVALRRASDEELRKLARFRLQCEQSKYLD